MEEDREKTRRLILELSSEFSQSAIETSNIGIRTLILINGGAVIALLTLVGVLLSAGVQSDLKLMLFAIAAFACGVGCGGWVSYFAYEVNLADFRFLLTHEEISDHPFAAELAQGGEEAREKRNRIHARAKVTALASLFLFFIGVCCAGTAIWLMSEQSSQSSMFSTIRGLLF